MAGHLCNVLQYYIWPLGTVPLDSTFKKLFSTVFSWLITNSNVYSVSANEMKALMISPFIRYLKTTYLNYYCTSMSFPDLWWKVSLKEEIKNHFSRTRDLVFFYSLHILLPCQNAYITHNANWQVAPASSGLSSSLYTEQATEVW